MHENKTPRQRVLWAPLLTPSSAPSSTRTWTATRMWTGWFSARAIGASRCHVVGRLTVRLTVLLASALGLLESLQLGARDPEQRRISGAARNRCPWEETSLPPFVLQHSSTSISYGFSKHRRWNTCPVVPHPRHYHILEFLSLLPISLPLSRTPVPWDPLPHQLPCCQAFVSGPSSG